MEPGLPGSFRATIPRLNPAKAVGILSLWSYSLVTSCRCQAETAYDCQGENASMVDFVVSLISFIFQPHHSTVTVLDWE
jgi:hypothetical protein